MSHSFKSNAIFYISYCSHETDGKGIVLTNTTLGNGDSINAGDAAALVINNCQFFSNSLNSNINKNIINGKRTNAFTFQVAGQAEPGDELPLPETVDKWHYVSLK